MGDGAGSLAALVSEELSRPAPDAAQRLAAEVVRRHGESVAAVVFYGSCLRKDTDEGVLDFYAIVDGYRAAYPASRALAIANRLLPPNVFYLEVPGASGTLRSKYAVVSSADFLRAAGTSVLRTGIWARFSQPALAVYARDPEARALLLEVGVCSVLTALRRLVPLLPESEGVSRFGAEEFWQHAFRETYACEMRPESPQTVQTLFAADPVRFERAIACGLAELDGRGELSAREEGDRFRVSLAPGVRRSAQRTWALRKPLAKLAYVAQLVKTAFTFGDWLPYVLWKLQRHTGARIVPTQRQRRHPFVYGWPLLARVLWRRELK